MLSHKTEDRMGKTRPALNMFQELMKIEDVKGPKCEIKSKPMLKEMTVGILFPE